jgi:ribosomal protein L35AE/L33A
LISKKEIFLLKLPYFSICGEIWSDPKRLEKGGDLYRGFIVRTYQNTGVIDATFQVYLFKK